MDIPIDNIPMRPDQLADINNHIVGGDLDYDKSVGRASGVITIDDDYAAEALVRLIHGSWGAFRLKAKVEAPKAVVEAKSDVSVKSTPTKKTSK